jgi:RNA polymerase sigma factor (sigma-70 family)
MEGSTARSGKWTLTSQALEVFLTYLDPERERAGEKYEAIRRTLITFFRCNGCWNAEDPVDETIDRVIRRLGEVEVRNLMPFIRGVARHVVSEKHKNQKKGREVPLEEVPEPSQWRSLGEESEQEMDRRLECLDQCVRRLDQNDRELVREWYTYDKSQKIEHKRQLAAARGISAQTLRVRAHRVRQRLQGLVEECLKVASRIM